MKDSIKQMLRTPGRTAGIFFLLVLSSLLLTLGGNLWMANRANTARYKDRFMTIATADQEPSSMVQEMDWDAEKQGYEVWRKSAYSAYYPAEELLFPEAGYLAGPEKRFFYGSYVPEYIHPSEVREDVADAGFVAEFEPLERCVPDQSVRIIIKRVINGDVRMEGSVVWFCDHENPSPGPMEPGQTYVAFLSKQASVHGELAAESDPSAFVQEYHPFPITSSLYTLDGQRVADELDGAQRWFAVTDGFYETAEGKRILNIAESIARMGETQPVTGTGRTWLLMAFYNGDAVITSGRDISEEEYETGAKVCLAPEAFLERNGLSVGDQVETRLYFSASVPAGIFFHETGYVYTFHTIDETGSLLEPFETSSYEIVGAYKMTGADPYSDFNMGADELVVPLKSIEKREGYNVIASFPMKDTNTSFQIPNGTVDEFITGWEKTGKSGISFTFYDMGYSRLETGMANMQNMSFVLLMTGVIMTGALLFFSVYVFITKQKERIAVERLMGVGKKKCSRGMVSALAALLFAGCICGVLFGSLFVETAMEKNMDRTYYSTQYSNISSAVPEEIGMEGQTDAGKLGVAVCVLLLTVGGGSVAAGWKMHLLLKQPLIRLMEEVK